MDEHSTTFKQNIKQNKSKCSEYKAWNNVRDSEIQGYMCVI